MILHVHDVAINSNVGQVIVATPDQSILELIKKYNGKAVLTSNKHKTGTDRIFEVFEKELDSKPEIIINFQGDMPNLNSNATLLKEDTPLTAIHHLAILVHPIQGTVAWERCLQVVQQLPQLLWGLTTCLTVLMA